MHGLLLIDKPAGISSTDVVRDVRRLFKTRKVGHAGTLDPMATGVLPVAVGDGTKILQFLLNDRKAYRAELKFGQTTDTYDSEGTVLTERPVPELTFEHLDQVCEAFRGDILQIPPMYSALKKDGVPLYKLARKGEVIEREARPVTIYQLDIVALAGDRATINVCCSKGTYIRSLIYDIGEALGCGAHMTALRRTASAGFRIDECVGLEDLKQMATPQDCLLPVEEAVRECPSVEVAEVAVERLNCGVPPTLAEVIVDDSIPSGSLVRLMHQGRLWAMARYAPHREQEKRGDFELIRVFTR